MCPEPFPESMTQLRVDLNRNNLSPPLQQGVGQKSFSWADFKDLVTFLDSSMIQHLFYYPLTDQKMLAPFFSHLLQVVQLNVSLTQIYFILF